MVGIGASAFSGCSGLTRVTIPDGITNIADHVFSGCSGLTSVTIPDSVVGIGASAFFGCSGLTNVMVPNSVTDIGDNAFRGCSELTSVTISRNVTNIGCSVFYDCIGLTNLVVESETISSSTEGLIQVKFNSRFDRISTIDSADECFIVSGVIAAYQRVEEEPWEFHDQIMGGMYFWNEKETTFAYFGQMFLEGGKTYIFSAEFDDDVYVKVNGRVLINVVGSSAYRSYANFSCATSGWYDIEVRLSDNTGAKGPWGYWWPSDFGFGWREDGGSDRPLLISEARLRSPTLLFSGCSNLESITITSLCCPMSEMFPDAYARIEHITITGELTSIPANAFAGCASLKSIRIPNTITNIGTAAFEGCNELLYDLTSIPGVKLIDGWVVGNTGTLSGHLNLAGACGVGDSALLGCNGLTSVTIPDDVSIIGKNAFKGCTGLSNIVFDGDKPTIGENAFADVDPNCRVYISRSASGWGGPVPRTWNGLLLTYPWYTVCFNANGGSCVEASLNIDYGSSIGALPEATRKDYNLVGWFTAAEGGNEVTAGSAVTGEMTVYAHWVLRPNVWFYEVVDGKVTITGNSTPEGDIAIPAEIDGCPVTAIATNTFYGCTGLTGVMIPDCVTEIGKDAFYGCAGLTNLVIEGNVEFATPGLIQAKFNSRFDKTATLDSANERSVVSGAIAAYQKVTASPWEFQDPIIGGIYAWNERSTTFAYFGQMFLECGKTYVFGSNFDDDAYVKVDGQVLVDVAGSSSFMTGSFPCTASGWYDIEVRLSDNSGEKGCWGNIWTTDFGFGWRDDGGTDSTQSQWKHLLVTEARLRCGAESPFSGCTNLKSVTIQSLSSTMSAMFPDSFAGIESVIVTGETTSIPACAFSGCASLKSFTIPDSVTDIGNNVFTSCIGLTEVLIPQGVTNIGHEVFAECAGLRYVEVAKALEPQIKSRDVFAGCPTDMEIVYVSPDIRNVAAKQRYPWNGKIDIAYSVIGNIFPNTPVHVSAIDSITGSNYMASAMALSGDMGTSEGSHNIIWDLEAQGLAFKSDDVVLSVSYGELSRVYCVIDLSAGSSASSYPVSYLVGMPLEGWTEEYKTTKLVLRLIEPGAFKMGGEYNAMLTKPYYMGVFEVTQKQYALVTGNNPSYSSGDMRPVERVSWYDANSFVGLIRSRTGLDFNLPTEAQWEYACRAGTTSSYNNGGDSEDDLKLLGRYSGNTSDGKGGYSGAHTVVGAYLPNAWGLYDMHGNVWEWCLDWYGELSSNMTDPTGPSSGSSRNLRGGSYYNGWDRLASPYRDCDNPSSVFTTVGFRICCSTDISALGNMVCIGDSNPLKVDSYAIGGALDSIVLPWNVLWVGGNANATVVIMDNGSEIRRVTDVGEFLYTPSSIGRHELTYTTYIDGAAQDEVYSATVFARWKHEVVYGGAVITETTQKTGAITIPSEIDNYPVVAIGNNAFMDCTNLTSVTMPVGVVSIGSYAFAGCSNMVDVTIPVSVTNIESSAFRGCISLTDIAIPNGVTSIGNDAFNGCSNLTSVTIPDGVTNIGWRTEFPCLQEISLPLSLNGVVTRKNVQEIFGCPANVSLIYRGAPPYVTITLDANGGDLGGAESVRQYALGDVVGALPLPTREGYRFDGWMLADETVTADTVVTMTAGCSLVAHWTINSYAISYDPNGGDGTMDETAATYGSETVVAANGFTRTGYRFIGWALEPDGEVVYAEGQSVTNLTMEPDGVVTLYAAWVFRDGYIESDGSAGAGINTGYFFGPQSKVEIDFQLTEEVNQCRLFGATGSQNNDTNPECECYIGSNNGLKFSYICGKSGNARQANNFRATDTQRHRIVLDFYEAKQFQVWTGDSVSVKALDPFPANQQKCPITFFCKNYTEYGTYSSSMTTLEYPSKMRVYRFRIWDAGVLVRDYVPCVRGGVPGFKETCSGRFVTGENIAAFTAGGDVSEETDAPYISFSGNIPGQAVSGSTIYMDTGYQFKPNSRIELDYAIMVNWTANNLYGSQGSDMFDGPTSGSYKLYLFAYGSRADKGYYYWKVGTAEGSIPQIGLATAHGVRRTVSVTSNTMCIVTAGYTNIVKTASASQAITMNLNGTLKLGTYLPMRIYGLKIYESDVLLKDYRPFVTNGVPGLIDAQDPSISLFPVTYNGGGRTNVVAEVGGDLDSYTMPKEKDAYLEFDGQISHQIDTGYVLSHDSCIEADFSLYSTAYNGQQEFFKQQLSTAAPNILVRMYINSAYTLSYQFEDYSTYKTAVGINTGISATSNARRQYRLDGYNSRVTITCGDDVLYDLPMEREHNNAGRTETLKIGTNRACMRLYGFKISEADEMVRNYVPAVENGQSGLYDLCTKTFLPLEGGQVSSLSQQPSRYTVTFDANGGDGGMSVKQDYRSAIIAPTVTRTGYTFKGWEPEVAAMVPAEDVTYTAQWEINQYTVTFNANGGVGSISGTQNYGTAIDVPADPIREGYTFKGWTPAVVATVPASNVTYTAQWEINRYVVVLNANGGACSTAELCIEHGATVGELPVPTRAKAVFLGWFTEAEGGDVVDTSLTVTNTMTLYAHWLTEVEAPVISTGGMTFFRTNQCEVTITCATEHVTIYYTDDGSTPRMDDDYLYTGPITITDTTTFKAVAVIGDIQSDYVTVTITKKLLTLEEALDGGEGVLVATGVDVPWRPVFDDTAKVGDATARSGEIGNRTNTWLSASVSGAGAMTFWCKTSCEHDEDGTFTWDRLMVYTNGVEIADWRMDGETDWTQRTLAFAGGENTVRWVYFKDRTGAEGEDCAWVDAVTWTPAGGNTGAVVDAGGGKSVMVPGTWLAEHSALVEAAGGDASAALVATAANGRKVWECYALGLDPENADATNDFKITSFPLKADGTPDLEHIVFDPPQARWNVPATYKVKGAAELSGPWQEVGGGLGEAALPEGFRFFKVEVVLP